MALETKDLQKLCAVQLSFGRLKCGGSKKTGGLMLLLIDGYNLIKQVLGCQRVSHAQLTCVVAELERYLKRQRLQAIMILDGGQSAYGHEIKHALLTICFSGYQRTADEVIIKYLDEHDQQDIVVITSDRQLRNYAHSKRKETICADEFYYQFMKKDRGTRQIIAHNEQLQKLSITSPHELDDLMLDATHAIMPKEDAVIVHPRRKGAEGIVQRTLGDIIHGAANGGKPIKET